MDIRKSILPMVGAEAIPRVQPSFSDRQRQSLPQRKGDRKKPFAHPEPGDREEASLLGEDGSERTPESSRKGREIETVVDGIDDGEGERIQGGRLDVRA